jgi:hypothetical protein
MLNSQNIGAPADLGWPPDPVADRDVSRETSTEPVGLGWPEAAT